MKSKIWFSFMILFSSLFFFSDCSKEEESEVNPCSFSMSHYNRIKTGWPDQGNGFNTSDFSALPGGVRNPLGTFSDFRIGQWWSSTKDPKYDFLWCRSMLYNYAGINRGLVSMQTGCSIRCTKY